MPQSGQSIHPRAKERRHREAGQEKSRTTLVYEGLKRFFCNNIGANVSRSHGAYAVLVWVGGYLICGYAASLLCSFIGFVYPAYKSVKAIESTGKGDDTAWLMYWVVYASFSCLEFFSDILLSWVPLYFLIKCVFLVWCMAPISYNGSKVIYNKLIRPWVLKNENKIDEVFGYVSNNAEKLANKVPSGSMRMAKDFIQSQCNSSPVSSRGQESCSKELYISSSSESGILFGAQQSQTVSDVVTNNIKNIFGDACNVDSSQQKAEKARYMAVNFIKQLLEKESNSQAIFRDVDLQGFMQKRMEAENLDSDVELEY